MKTPEELRAVLDALQSVEAIIVGGQAINLWSGHYSDANAEWQQYLPFSSEDLDLFGGRIEVQSCAEALRRNGFQQLRVALAKDFDPSPNAGVILADLDDTTQLRIDILSAVYGINDAELETTAMRLLGQGPLKGMTLRVQNPILCLEGKLKALSGLPQNGRQDKKHLALSTLFVRRYLQEQCSDLQPRPGLKQVERVLGSCLREDGLKAWLHHKIDLASAIPWQHLKELQAESWQRFRDIRQPQLKAQITSKRERYRQMEIHLQERRQLARDRQERQQDSGLSL